MRLVQFGRPKIERLIRIGQKSTPLLRLTEKELLTLTRRVGPVAHSARVVLAREGRKPILYFQWHRMPKDWELSFVAKMKSAESRGIPFTEVLQTDLPLVLGQVPSGSPAVGWKEGKKPTKAICEYDQRYVRKERKENHCRPSKYA